MNCKRECNSSGNNTQSLPGEDNQARQLHLHLLLSLPPTMLLITRQDLAQAGTQQRQRREGRSATSFYSKRCDPSS